MWMGDVMGPTGAYLAGGLMVHGVEKWLCVAQVTRGP